MTVSELTAKMNLTVVHEGDPGREVTGGYVGDLLSWVMGKARAGNAWITIMSNHNVAAVASLCDVSCIILAENVEPDESLRGKFRMLDAAILRSPLGAFELASAMSDAMKIA